MENGHVNGEPRRTSSLLPALAPVASTSVSAVGADGATLVGRGRNGSAEGMKTPPRGPPRAATHHPFATPRRDSGDSAPAPSDSGSIVDARPAVSPRSSSLDPLGPVAALSPERAGAAPSAAASAAADASRSGTPARPAPDAPDSAAGTPGGAGPRVPSRQLLQAALDLAQRAVEMDKLNDVLGALAAYREAVRRLRVVMERVGVEPKDGKRKGKTEEEGRTLRGILLSEYERDGTNGSADDAADAQARQSLDDGSAAIGSLMLSDPQSPPRLAHAAFDPSTPSRQQSPSLSGVGSPAAPSLHQVLDTPQTVRSGETSDFMSPTSSRHGSHDYSSPRRRLRASRMAAHGLDDEADLSGIDGVNDDGIEELARTPRDDAFADADEARVRPESIAASVRSGAADADAAKSLPPLPPVPGHARSSSRKSNLAGVVQLDFTASTTGSPATQYQTSPALPASGSGGSLALLVSPSTAHGTISQRRHGGGRTPAGQSMSSISEFAPGAAPAGLGDTAIDGLPAGARDAPHPFSRVAPTPTPTPPPAPLTPVPAEPSPPTPSGPLGRLRAKSQPGHRPSQLFRQSQQAGSDVPPVPQLRSGQPAPGPDARAGHQRGAASVQLRLNADALAPPVPLPARPGERAGAGPRSAAPSPRPDEQPADVVARPFHLLRVLAASMDDAGRGAFLSPALHVDPAVWHAATWVAAAGKDGGANGAGGAGGGGGAAVPKIAAQEVKARTIDALLLHLDALRHAGRALLDGPRDGRRRAGDGAGSGTPQLAAAADDFVAALDGLDDELDSAHRALSGKGVAVGAWKGKAGGSGKSWGSRFSRSVDKMTTGKQNADSPEKYVDLLLHLCYNAQVINDHLSCLLGPCTPAYRALPEPAYRQIEARVLRAAAFFGAVVAPFVLDDFRQFLLRYLKGGIRYLED